MPDQHLPLLWPPEVADKPGVREAAEILMIAWQSARLCLNSRDGAAEKDAIALFARNVLGLPSPSLDPIPDGPWEPVRLGSLRPGDIVRVRYDAFPSPELAKRHNGRICEVLWVEGGDVIVASRDGKDPALTSTRYSPHDLLRLVPRG